MSNLISREDLKEALKSKVDQDKDDLFVRGYNIGIEAAMELIDNAPTVDANEPTLNESIAFHNGYELGKSERPQGKWVFSIPCINEIGTWNCSNCNYMPVVPVLSNYCPNCGADMREDSHGQ